MPLKDILVHLDASPRSQARLALATALARRHGAHLVGLCVVDVVLPVMALADGGGGGTLLAELIDQMRQDGLEAARGIEESFREHVRREGISAEWRMVEGALPEQVALQARYADLTVVGQVDPDSPVAGAGLALEQVLFAAGRPMLVVPHSGEFAEVGRRVLLGWNASREATRAVHDAMPILAAAERVTVLAVNPATAPNPHGEEPGADIALHLARHGVTAQVERGSAAIGAEGDALLNQATDLAADLIVVGAYGHSRLREMVLGGVTRTLLRSMTVPVLMSH
ncbi:universal stress protein [Paracraurococcus lichenis]|uniref:Universal stress protein n=1 Tax=Paracraurococcus lichenis TaxID=3064888 RepID=A0ABT9E5I1_9PROT|nr:universal stress protein [Paracraurococcus sp. LOR1-02]MDO9711424.1 universal stress protein [Paracraurococcus sp. LOR1-02]